MVALGLKERFLAGEKAPVLFAFENAPSDAGARAKTQLIGLTSKALDAMDAERESGNKDMPKLDGLLSYIDRIFAPQSMIDRIVPGSEDQPREVRTPDGARFQDRIATNTEAYKGQITLLGDPKEHDIPEIEGFRWVNTQKEFDGVKADKRNLLNTMHAVAGVMSGLPLDASPTTLPQLMDGKETRLGFNAVMDSITHATPDRGEVKATVYSGDIRSRLGNKAMGDGGEKLERLGSQMPRKLNGYIKATLVDMLRQGGNVDRLMNTMVVAANRAETQEYQAYCDSRGITEGPKSREAFLDQYEGYPITREAILKTVPEDVRDAFSVAWDRAETRRDALGDKTLLLPQDYAGQDTARLFKERGLDFGRFLADPSSLKVSAPGDREVVFALDNDGTVVNSEIIALPTAQALVNEIVTGLEKPDGSKGESVSQEDFNSRYAGMNFNLILKSVLEDQGFPSMSEGDIAYWEKVEDDRIADELIKQDVKVTPHALEAIKCLKASGIGNCIATSASSMRAFASLGHTGLKDVIGEQYVFSGADMGKAKPLPDVYIKALREMNVPVDAIKIAVEDSGSGAKAAMAAEMTALVGMLGGEHIAEERMEAVKKKLIDEGATFIVSDLAQMLIAAHDAGIIELSQTAADSKKAA